MGNSSSSTRGHGDPTVDFGALGPPKEYPGLNTDVVAQLIVHRRLAPFYRPLDDYQDDFTDEQILAARKKPQPPPDDRRRPPDDAPPVEQPSRTAHSKKATGKDTSTRSEATMYRGAIECPICFLYYPSNINYSRCCGQAICTDCFVQIKRSEPTTTHLVSEMAACPYCVQENFGIVYTPPLWRAGIASDGHPSPFSDSPKGSQQSIETPSTPTHKRRQKSFSADSPEVVTTDHIRPDWEAKLAAVKAAVARRANRRIIMRQVGDRLIPVGVTSGRLHALSPEEAAAAEQEEGNSSRRSRRRHQNPPNGAFEQYVGIGGQDLEELMMMEAMRLSLLEHEEHQRKQAEEEKKKKGKGGPGESSTSSDAGPSGLTSSSVPSSSAMPSNSTEPHVSQSLMAGSSATPRSRSPQPLTSQSGFEPTSDPIASSIRQTHNPPQFSALSAALTTAGTAAAVLSPPAETPQQSTPTPSSPITPTLQAVDGEAEGSGSADAAPKVHPTTSDSGGTSDATPPRPIPTHQDSFASSISSVNTTGTARAYDELPSSPESMGEAGEPLLPSAAEPGSPARTSDEHDVPAPSSS